MIPFNRPPYTGYEDAHVLAAMRSDKISGDGRYSRRCQEWFVQRLGCAAALLTPSCTHALEMAALLLDIGPGDEIIMPSYTFVSTANAFALRGARIVFIDVDPQTMNLDVDQVLPAITERTRAIVPVHYAGMACDMTRIMDIAESRELCVVEDAAQGMLSTHHDQPLGAIGHLAAYSFHETKNYTSGGEGGLLIVNDPRFVESAEIVREKGTNRSAFFRGMVDKYSWVSLGSSYLPSEIQAAYLWAQLERADEMRAARLHLWTRYSEGLADLVTAGKIEVPVVPQGCSHNGHMFWIKLNDLAERTAFLAHLLEHEVMGVFHYVPLHSSQAGRLYGRFSGADNYTTRESERLVRLPIWHGMTDLEQERVIASAHKFFNRAPRG